MKISSIKDIAAQDSNSKDLDFDFEDDEEDEHLYDFMPSMSRSSKDTYLYLKNLQQVKCEMPKSIYDFPRGKLLRYGYVDVN